MKKFQPLFEQVYLITLHMFIYAFFKKNLALSMSALSTFIIYAIHFIFLYKITTV